MKGSCWCKSLHRATGSEGKGPPSDLPCEGADSWFPHLCGQWDSELFLRYKEAEHEEPPDPGGRGVSPSPPRMPVSDPVHRPWARRSRLSWGLCASVLCQGRGPSSAQKIPVQIQGGAIVHTPRFKRRMMGKEGEESWEAPARDRMGDKQAKQNTGLHGSW